MEYLEGEAAPGRNGIHTHGGRIQEPELSNTHGCIRMADEDIKELKEITERLEVFDSKEKEERFCMWKIIWKKNLNIRNVRKLNGDGLEMVAF